MKAMNELPLLGLKSLSEPATVQPVVVVDTPKTSAPSSAFTAAELSVMYPPAEQQAPRLLPSGNIFIPFNCPPKYRWWAGGQSYVETGRELGGRKFKA